MSELYSVEANDASCCLPLLSSFNFLLACRPVFTLNEVDDIPLLHLHASLSIALICRFESGVSYDLLVQLFMGSRTSDL